MRPLTSWYMCGYRMGTVWGTPLLMICPIMADLWSMDGRGAGREVEVQNKRWKGMGGERREGVLCEQHSRHVCEYTALTPLPPMH